MNGYNWVDKAMSARRFLAVCSGICLLVLTVSYVLKGKDYSVSPEAIVAIIASVFASYFGKDRSSNGNGNGNGGSNGNG